MGEVYRAHDTKLGRDVALKTLPASFASDPERLARFEREAKTLASLNHPHIAQIYGFEQSGEMAALVMELVEGDDLSARIARGPLPLDEALPIARQIAEALEAAHEQGIIHRDLKPANIKVRADGAVKVLDFGLAKALESGPGMATADRRTCANSPTITTPAMTQRGMILGTAAYMSPEQAKGKPVDKRADIWAFGCVLYEMLAGRRAFEGEDVSDTLAAILRGEPDWTLLPALPPAVLTSSAAASSATGAGASGRCPRCDSCSRIPRCCRRRAPLPRRWLPARCRRAWRPPWRRRAAMSWCVVSSLWRISPPSQWWRPSSGSPVASRATPAPVARFLLGCPRARCSERLRGPWRCRRVATSSPTSRKANC